MKISEAVWKMAFGLLAGKLHKRFVAGDTIEEAVAKAKFYKERGEKSTINILGEHAKDRETAEKFCSQIVELMILLNKEGLTDVNVAEKPSQIGMDISGFVYLFNKARILSAAQKYLPGAFIETDAEDHFYRQKVLKIILELSKNYSNQLLACQLNRKEAIQEIKMLQGVGIPVRICKGNAYKGEIEKEKDLRKVYLESASLFAPGGKKPLFATHDLFLIDSIAGEFSQDKDRFEFELLMGMEEGLHGKPHLKGFIVRRYIPCGPNWRPYGERRGKAVAKILLRNWWYKIRKGGGKNEKNTIREP